MKLIMGILFILLCLLLVHFFYFYPNQLQKKIKKAQSQSSSFSPLLNVSLNQVSSFLTQAEADAEVQDLYLQKRVKWYNLEEETEWSIVYLHGFSASPAEVEPFCSQLSDSLHANVFFQRFKGHGLSGEALATASYEDWLDDTMEAIWMGKRLGKKVLLVATSTGATLALTLLNQMNFDFEIRLILISPNLGVRQQGTYLMRLPFSKSWLPLFLPKIRSWTPQNPLHEKFWTHHYPYRAVFPMLESLQGIGLISKPLYPFPMLLIYSKEDHVIDVIKLEKFFKNLPADRKYIPVNIDDHDKHVVIGKALSPHSTQDAVDKVMEFLKG